MDISKLTAEQQAALATMSKVSSSLPENDSWEKLFADFEGTPAPVEQPKGGNKYSHLSDEEFKALGEKNGFKPKQPEGNEFTRGVARGVDNSISLVKEGVPALAKGIANETQTAFNHAPSFDPTKNLEQYQKETEATAKKYPTKFSDFTDVHSMKDFGSYLAAAGGESVPSLVTSMISGGMGGAAAKFGASQAMKRAGVAVTKEALDKALMKGVAYGALASSAPQNIPETYLGLLAKGQDRPGLALAIGSVKSALDIATPEMLLGKLLGAKVVDGIANEGAKAASDIVTNTWAKKIGFAAKEVGHGAAMEFGTEGSQEGLGILAEHLSGINPELMTADNFIRVMDNGLRGAIGGGLAGAGVHLAQAAPHITNPLPQAKDKFQELRDKLGVMQETASQPNPSMDEMFKEEVVGTAPGAIKTQAELPLAPVQNKTTAKPKAKPLTQPTIKVEDFNPAGALREDVLNAKGQLPKSKISPRLLAAVQANAQLTDEQVQKIKDSGSLDLLNSSVFHPIQVEPTIADQLKETGVNVESLSNLSVEERAKAMKDIDAMEQAKAVRKKAGRKAIPKQASLPFEAGIKELKGQKKQLRKVKIDDPIKFQGKDKPKFQRTGPTPKEAQAAILQRRAVALTGLNEQIKKLQKEHVDFLRAFGGLQKIKQTATKPSNKRTHAENEALQKHDTFLKGLEEKKALRQKIENSPIASTEYDPSFNTFNLQRGPMTDIYDNVYDGQVVVEEIRQHIEGSPLTPQAQKQFLPIIKELKRILKEVSGTGELVMFDRLQDTEGNPVLGMQFMNLVFMAFDRGMTMSRAVNTAYHEVWHMLESRGVFTAKQVHILDNNTKMLRYYADKDGYLKDQDFDYLMSTQWGREELRANAFGLYASDKRLGIQPKGLSGLFKTYFDRAINIMDKFRNAMKGLGFNSYQDIFDSAIEGKHAIENLNEARYSYQMARIERGAEQLREALNYQREAQAVDNIKELTAAGKARQAQNKNPVNYGKYTRLIRSIHDLANKSPIAAAVYNAVTRRYALSSSYLNAYMNTLGAYLNSNKEIRHRVASLTDRITNLKTKAWVAEDGSLRWIENDQEMKISDPRVGQAYMSMQKTFQRVLSDYENLIKAQAQEAFPEFLQPGFTTSDALLARDRAKAIRDSSDLVKDEDTYQSLKNLVDHLENFAKMRLNDYFPKMRFGTYGFVVKDKEGKQVALYNFEKGYGNDLYNKVQMQKILDEIKTKYSDTTKFDVYGDGKITDFTNAKPYTMNYNKRTDMLNDQLVTHETLFQLLHTKNITDQDAFDQSVNNIINDFTGRKFEKKFSESKDIDGYSKDYDRVLHSYFTGSAHFLSSLASAKEISNLKVEVNKLKNENGTLAQALNEYIDYNSSPQEDLQELRTFNFLWTMGGNLSTALLQVVTLPTLSNGLMTEYAPNTIQNMKLLGKYFTKGIQIMRKHPKGSFSTLNFGELGALKGMSEDQRLANSFMVTTGKFAGLAVENQGKLKTFETDTNIGQAKEKMDIISRYLGAPVSIMEQLTRFATFNAAYDLIANNHEAAAKAREQLKDNPLFQEKLRNNPNPHDFALVVAEMLMDDAHGVFGKQGRPHVYKGLGGAVVVPFQTYPHYALEAMVRMYGRGPDGKRALFTTLTAMFLIGGLMGLPGVDAIKELLEALENQLTGSEEDWVYELQTKIMDLTGSPTLAKTLTGGLTRSALGVDVSKRTGLAIPGQELALTLLGVRGEATNMVGVEGSVLQNLVDTWNGYNNGDQGLAASVGSAVLPTGATNILKAINYGSEGVSTRNGTQLLTDKEVTAQTRLLKAIGIRSDQIATATESSYYNTLIQGKYKVGIDRFRKQVTNIKTDIYRAQEKDDQESLHKLHADLQEKMQELRDYVKDNDIRPFPYASFNKTTNMKAQENTREKPSLKGINRSSRAEIRKKNDMYEKWLEGK